MAAGHKTGGRTKGTPFQGNLLALLQAVYRDTSQELRVRIDAAGRALPYEMSRPENKTAAPDVVPLHERIKEFAREKEQSRPPRARWWRSTSGRPARFRDFQRQ